MRWTLSIALSIAGCGAPPVMPDPDAGPSSYTIAEPAPPAPPMAPVFTCPGGWRERDLGDGARACEPFASDVAPSCGPDELTIPGSGCEPIDTCPADGWPADLPAIGVVYVRAGATGGDGTRALPFGTLAEGLTAARGREVILALAAGNYDGGSTLELRNRELRGACASGTVISDPTFGSGQATLTAYVVGTRMRGVRITGGSHALWIAPTASVDASEVILEGGEHALRLDSDASFTGDRVRIAGGTSSVPTYNQTACLRPRTTIVLRRSTLSGGGGVGIGTCLSSGDLVESGIAVTMEDSSIVDSTVAVAGWLDIVLTRVALERLAGGIDLLEGASAELTDVRARAIAPTAATPAGSMVVSATEGGDASVSRMWVSRAESGVFLVGDPGGTFTASDVVAFDCDRVSVFSAIAEATMELDRVVVRRIGGSIDYATQGATLTMRDADVESVRPTTGGDGDLVLVHDSGRVVLERVRAHDLGRLAGLASSGGIIEATDVDVAGGMGFLAQCAPEAGMGCQDGAPSSLVLTRARFGAMDRFAIAVERASGTLADIDVETVTGDGDDSGGGFGIYVSGPATAERVRVGNGTRHSILVAGESGLLTASDLRVEHADPLPCASEPCESRVAGDDIMCGLGGGLVLTRFHLSGAVRAGLGAALGCSRLELTQGEITGNTIGILTDATQTVPVFVQVRVHDNETDFNTTDLTVVPPTIVQ